MPSQGPPPTTSAWHQLVVEWCDTFLWWFQATAILTAGTMFVTWLGERITDRGIGNGISLIITIGIIAGLPGAFFQDYLRELCVRVH